MLRFNAIMIPHIPAPPDVINSETFWHHQLTVSSSQGGVNAALSAVLSTYCLLLASTVNTDTYVR